MEALHVLNFSMSVAGLVICILGLIQAITVRQMERRTRLYFITFFIIIIVYAACNLFWQVIREYTNSTFIIITRIIVFLESLVLSSLTVLLTGFLLDQSHVKNRRKNVIFYMVTGLWLVYFGLLVYAQFSKNLYYIDAENGYHHGPSFPLLMLPLIFIMILNLFLYFRRASYLNEKQKIAFAIYLVVPLTVMFVEMFFYGMPLIIFGVAVSAMMMFV